MKNYKLLTINEWKQSEMYAITTWMNNLNKKIKTYFDENETYKDLNYDSYRFDSSQTYDELTIGYIYFSEKNAMYNYRLEIVIDNLNINDNIVEKFDLILYIFDKNNENLYNNVKTKLKKVDEINEDSIIELINKIKNKNNIE